MELVVPASPLPDVIPECGDRVSCYSLEMDPRVEVEMEKLNRAIADVNNLDGELFEAKQQLQKFVTESRRKLDKVYRAHRKSIERSRPFFKAKSELEEIQRQLRLANGTYETFCLDFDDAKENEALAEKVLEPSSGMHFMGTAGMDVLDNWNKATRQVLEASKRKTDADKIRQQLQDEETKIKVHMSELQFDLKKVVDKAWTYYTLLSTLEKQLEAKAEVVRVAGSHLAAAKEAYKEAFASLDLVAAEIEQRQKLRDLKNGIHTSNNLSQFEEIDNIECALESRFENMSLSRSECSLDQLSDTEPRTCSLTYPPALAQDQDLGPMGRSMSLVELSASVWDSEGKPAAITLEAPDDCSHGNGSLASKYFDVSFQMEV